MKNLVNIEITKRARMVPFSDEQIESLYKHYANMDVIEFDGQKVIIKTFTKEFVHMREAEDFLECNIEMEAT